MKNGTSLAINAHALSYEVDAKALLSNVDLHAKRGQFVGLIGPNGAGKTTLLRALAGILRYREGAVLLEGADLKDATPREIAKTLGLVPRLHPTPTASPPSSWWSWAGTPT